jgi:hypothetical protein
MISALAPNETSVVSKPLLRAERRSNAQQARLQDLE